MNTITQTESIDPRWKGLYQIGVVAIWSMLAIMVVQVVIFAVWPPPQSAEGFFALLRENWLLGLLSLDLLYLVNNALLIPIYLALYVTLKNRAEGATLTALVVGLVGVASYYASSITFEMLSLSGAYAAASTDAQRTALLAVGEGLLATYKGTAFDVYYVFNAIILLVFSVVMLKSNLYSRPTAYWGLAAGVLMAIPSNAGTIGMVFALVSLVPWAVFIVYLARRFARFSAGV